MKDARGHGSNGSGGAQTANAGTPWEHVPYMGGHGAVEGISALADRQNAINSLAAKQRAMEGGNASPSAAAGAMHSAYHTSGEHDSTYHNR